MIRPTESQVFEARCRVDSAKARLKEAEMLAIGEHVTWAYHSALQSEYNKAYIQWLEIAERAEKEEV